MRPRPSSLYVCYLSLADPLAETQVVAYLAGLAAAGHRIHLLTFEPAGAIRSETASTRARLASRGIVWHRARYHKRPSLPATILDVLAGTIAGCWLALRHDLDVVHARSHVPAAMALGVRTLARRPFIFDIRGLMAEEYVDAGRWRPGGIPFRLTKAVERLALRQASGAVVLTEGARDLLFARETAVPVEVIPCCVDLDRFETGATHSTLGGSPRFAYVGKFSGWYMAQGMAELFARARARWSDAHFLILTQSDPEEIESELSATGAPAASYTITTAAHGLVGESLADADAGLSLIQPVPSKVASSPTKNAEYLAAGMPLIATAGVGGTDELAASAPGVVVVISKFDEAAYERALDELDELLLDPGTGDRCRSAAAEHFSLKDRGVPAYLRLYERVADRANATAP